MMRLIDADLIPYELWTTEVEVDKTRNNGTYHYFQNRYMVDRRAIEAMPTVNQWIPCSERLPDKDGDYLVIYDKIYANNNNYDRIISIAPFETASKAFGYWHRHIGTNGLLVDDWISIPITAWMPLPEPYGGDGK